MTPTKLPESKSEILQNLNTRLLAEITELRAKCSSLEQQLKEKSAEISLLSNLKAVEAAASNTAAPIDIAGASDQERLRQALAERDKLRVQIDGLKADLAQFAAGPTVLISASALEAMAVMAKTLATMRELAVPETKSATDHFAQMFMGKFTAGKDPFNTLREVHGQALVHAAEAMESERRIRELKAENAAIDTELLSLQQKLARECTKSSIRLAVSYALRELALKEVDDKIIALKAQLAAANERAEIAHASLIAAENRAIIAESQAKTAIVNTRELERRLTEANAALLFKNAECTALRQQLERTQSDTWNISQILGTDLLKALNGCDAKPSV